MSDVDYVLLGPWWTADAPSLRMPRPGGAVLDVWTAGNGPSLLLVGTAGAESWLELLPHLAEGFTVHALERSTRGRDDAGALSPVEVAAVVDALGAPFVLCAEPDADLVIDAVARTATATAVAVLGTRTDHSSTASPSGPVPVHRVPAGTSAAADARAVSRLLLEPSPRAGA